MDGPSPAPRARPLVPVLQMMSCRNNGLFWLVHIVKPGNGRITGARVLLWRGARLGEIPTNERNGEIGAAGAHIHPRIKNAEGKGETITAESNNRRLQIPSIRFKDTNQAAAA